MVSNGPLADGDSCINYCGDHDDDDGYHYYQISIQSGRRNEMATLQLIKANYLQYK